MGDGYKTTVRTETVEYSLDDALLAAPVASAVCDAIRAGIAGITEMSPDGKHRLFNRTGALVSGLHVDAAGATYEVLPPADHFQGPNGDAMIERLRELVPALQDPLGQPRVQTEIEKTLDQMMREGPVTLDSY